MKTTKADFEYYKKCVQKWVDLFQLNDWEVYYVHENTEDYIGYCLADVNSHQVTIILGTDWGVTEINKKSIDKVAFHEVMELLLTPYHYLAKSRTYDIDKHTTISHQMIRTLEHVVFHDGKNRP